MRLFFISLLCALALTGCPQAPEAPETAVAAESAKKEAVAQSDNREEASSAKKIAGSEVNYSCKQDSDCAVKDVGNCCGHYPACVYKDSPTFPDKVQAECKEKGMMSTCGFREISSCKCVANRCEAASNGQPEEAIQ